MKTKLDINLMKDSVKSDIPKSESVKLFAHILSEMKKLFMYSALFSNMLLKNLVLFSRCKRCQNSICSNNALGVCGCTGLPTSLYL